MGDIVEFDTVFLRNHFDQAFRLTDLTQKNVSQRLPSLNRFFVWVLTDRLVGQDYYMTVRPANNYQPYIAPALPDIAP